jgi:hypothetical protein
VVEAVTVVAVAAWAAVGTAAVALGEVEWAQATVVVGAAVGGAELAVCWVGQVVMEASSLRRHHRGLERC